MKLFNEIWMRWSYWLSADRLGPDIPATHWRLYFNSLMLGLCKKKFLRFSSTAEFRPGAYAIACSKISIGNRVVIRPGCMLFADPRDHGEGITIEDDVLVGSGVHIYVSNHQVDSTELPIIDQGHRLSLPVVLKRGCWIGAGAILLPGVTIGENAVVGAGAVVPRSVEKATVVVGNPARVIRKIGECN